MKSFLKQAACNLLVSLGADRFGRRRHRGKVLVVMYHGVTRCDHSPAVWSQLPERVFFAQLKFLATHYQPVRLSQLIKALDGRYILPEQAVLITFDDGLRNNYSVAYPILKKLRIPAAIFLTVGLIGKNEFLWVDDLYLRVSEAARAGVPLPIKWHPGAAESFRRGNIWDAYCLLVEALKRGTQQDREIRMQELRTAVSVDGNAISEDFALLDWHQVKEMQEGGWIDFGVHTATHQILTRMNPDEAEQEILGAKKLLEFRLGVPAEAFCYPNGRSGRDWKSEHAAKVREAGYRCAFATDSGLFDPKTGDPFGIPRVPAGNDLTSDPAFFRLNASGFLGSRQ